MGGYYVRGGLYKIAQALRRLAEERGVSILTGFSVEEIQIRNGRVCGVRGKDGSTVEARSVVANVDPLTAYRNLLKDLPRAQVKARGIEKRELSCSGFVLCLGVKKEFPDLAQHNVFFSGDYREEFEDIFARKVPPRDPTVYVSISAKADPGMAARGGSNVYALVNVPPDDGSFDWESRAGEVRDVILRKLAPHLGDITPFLECEEHLTPRDFAARYGAWRGALYGPASHGPWASFLRPGNRADEIPGLYFAGGNVHPGGGIPLVLLSGKMAAELILSHD